MAKIFLPSENDIFKYHVVRVSIVRVMYEESNDAIERLSKPAQSSDTMLL